MNEIGVARARKSLDTFIDGETNGITVKIQGPKRNGNYIQDQKHHKKIRPSILISKDQIAKINYKCAYCNLHLKTQSDGVLHFRTIHPQKQQKLICEDYTAKETKSNNSENQKSIKVEISNQREDPTTTNPPPNGKLNLF